MAPLQLGESFAFTPQANELVTRDPYSRIRNRICVFVDVMICSMFLVLHLYWLFLLFSLLVATHALLAQRGAKVLQATFGQAHLDSRNHIWF
jgi:protein-S-isoprenylcysteine O-methyltransferase Ste14